MSEFSALRRQAGVTIPELATQLGMPEAAISDWEAGRNAPPSHVIRVLDFMTKPMGQVGVTQTTLVRSSEITPGDAQHAFPWLPDVQSKQTKSDTRTGAFTDNMKLPIHRWFRYSAGFSAEWVARLLEERRITGSEDFVFDPFAGSGTCLLAAETSGVPSAGAERHPFVFRIANAKLSWNCDLNELRNAADILLARAKQMERPIHQASDLLTRCFSPDALQRLVALREAFEAKCSPGSAIDELLWLGITSVLRECSGVGTAQWQYILPNKSKAKVADPYVAFVRRIAMFASDIAASKRTNCGSDVPARLQLDDARTLNQFRDLHGRVTCIITSPPYPNNYDYADATRLEMTYWGEVGSWGDLHRAVRHQLVRSCSQHTAAERLDLTQLLADPVLAPIQDDLRRVCLELAEIRHTKGGKKTYHTMVAAYFADLARVWQALRPLCAGGADICFVVGDSAPYGVHVPVDEWLASLAVAAGFHSPRFDKIRDRNLKWKNRKHRVPLKEGNLWLRG